MSTPTACGGPAGKTGRRRRPSSKCSTHRSSPRPKPLPASPQDATSVRLQGLLPEFPAPFPSLQVVKPIGEGTFSTVYLVSRNDDYYPESESERQSGKFRCRYALKYLIPTSSPERILMEVDCLRLAGGKANVLPLLFVHRCLGDVVLAMPYIEASKFSEVIKTMDFVELKLYMKNLLQALAHIHSLGIIHRDIKPANFLYDRKRVKFGLVDFGLAQRSHAEAKEIPIPPPICKRRLTSSDLANSMESPPPTKLRKRNSSADCSKSKVNSPRSTRKTPTKTGERPTSHFYDRRGSLLNQKKPRSSHSRPISEDEEECEKVCEEKENLKRTPKKNRLNELELDQGEVRRSPRKHPGSRNPGFSKITITGSAIIQQNQNIDQNSSRTKTTTFSRHNSFTILDPASGIPSDLGTPKLQASLTSRHSFITAGNGICNNSKNSATNLESLTGLINAQSSNSIGSKKPTFQRFNTPSLIDLARCDCYGRPRLCSKCTSRRSQKAARAGTPGFRPPEVLLKSEHQTTSVDMWAAGVILLCIMSRSYPFFRAPDDITALAEVTTLFGTAAVTEAASQYDKKFLCSEFIEPVDLKYVCEQLAARGNVPNEPAAPSLVTSETLDLLKKLLKLFAHERISAEDALKHPLFTA